LVTARHASSPPALEDLGFRTTIVERAFDKNFHPAVDRDEPTIALAGFDEPHPRRLLGGDRFHRVVDAGLGAGHPEYLDILVHTFPSPEDPATTFVERTRTARTLPDAYESEISRQVDQGIDESVARCGTLQPVTCSFARGGGRA
jgi:hypothetical protein